MNKLGKKICCISGHRPKSLPWKDKEEGEVFEKVKRKLSQAFETAIENGYEHFICGMALGIDLIGGEIILNLKKRYSNIFLECAIPCKNQCQFWKNCDKIRYNNIIKNADLITYVSPKIYFSGCMKLRNQYMVKKSDKIIAVFNGQNGGTKQTLEMAKNYGLEIEIIQV